MKLLLGLLLAVLATVAIAAPARHRQLPLNDRHRPAPVASTQQLLHQTATTATITAPHTDRPKVFPLPYVVKLPPGDPGSRDNYHAYAHAHAQAGHRHTTGWLPSWIKAAWRGSSWSTPSSVRKDPFFFSPASRPDLSCFCAGGAVCCHTATGLDCHAGYCGI